MAAGARFTALPEDALLERTSDALEEGCAVGGFQGRMEFGPRALGGCSILGDPRSPEMQRTLKLRVKYRGSFRPFAPSVLRITADEEALFGIDPNPLYHRLISRFKARTGCPVLVNTVRTRYWGLPIRRARPRRAGGGSRTTWCATLRSGAGGRRSACCASRSTKAH